MIDADPAPAWRVRMRMRRSSGAFAVILATLFCLPYELLHAETLESAEGKFFSDSNVTNAALPGDVRSDTGAEVNGAYGRLIDLDHFGLLALSLDLGAIGFTRYSGLNELDAGVHASLKKKLGMGPSAPWLKLSTSLSHLSFEDNVRNGWQTRAAASTGTRLFDRFDLALEAGYLHRSQENPSQAFAGISPYAFQQTNHYVQFSLDAELGEQFALLMVLSRRTGDTNLTIQEGGGGDFDEAKAVSPDPAFGPLAFAERVQAVTRTLDLGGLFFIDPKSVASLVFRRQLTREPSGDLYLKSVTTLTYARSF